MVGYGEPTFAAFYPNCRSVFGFHDEKYAENKPIFQGLQYDVIGWYSNPNQDYLKEFLEVFKREYLDSFAEPASLDELLEVIKDELQWKGVIFDDNGQSPDIICYSRLIFNPPPDYQGQAPLTPADITLAVGNTGTEALSAYLAQTINPSQKGIIEEQLEALQLSETLDSQNLDVGAKFQQMRHESGFDAVTAGIRWTIVLETQRGKAGEAPSESRLHLPERLLNQLADLNELQRTYNQNSGEIKSRRKQLFADWYKYMISAYPPEQSWDDYPDIDRVKYYVETEGLEPLQSLLDQTGEFSLVTDETGRLIVERAEETDNTLAFAIANGVNELITAINAYNLEIAAENNNNSPSKPSYRLETIADARYWQPTEPVLLMVGDEVKATQRYGFDSRLTEDGLLPCVTIPNKNGSDLINEGFETIIKHLDSLSAENTSIGINIWKEQPWNPFILQWLVELFPVSQLNNKTTENRKYGRGFLTANYSLKEQGVDLSPKSAYEVVQNPSNPNHIKTDRDSYIYSGFSLLTPYANFLLQERIETYLKKYNDESETMVNPVYQIISNYEQRLTNREPRDRQIENSIRKQIPVNFPQYSEAIAIDDDPYLSNLSNIQTLKVFFEENNLVNLPSPIFTAKEAQNRLKSLNCLSQSLGGLNEAMLMFKQTLQLEIDDPLGFTDYQDFTEAVKTAVAGENSSAPQPLDDFSPIRAGELGIIELSLIDSFGQVRSLNWDDRIITPEPLKTNEPERLLLPPRLVPPIRLNFRFLGADQGGTESFEDTPICGWIIPNNLNGSLNIHSNTGKALGAINTNGEWDYAPGNNTFEPNEIANLHLRKVVKQILRLSEVTQNSSEKFIDNFLITLNNALENIDPESFAQNQSLALLLGRPIAVVRASVNLELEGIPAINQDWHIFRQEMQQLIPLTQRNNDNFVNVDFPIRIGEYQQLNDGVIGYWKETVEPENEGGYGYENEIFYAQQSDSNESRYIETQFFNPNNIPGMSEESPINIMQSIASPGQQLTLLVDPRGCIHATSGILPSKVLTIPPEQYVDVLSSIEVTFLTSPIISERQKLNLPLPTEPEYDWSWLEKRGEQWSEIFTVAVIERSIFIANFPEENGETVWENLITQGWLRPLENETDKAEVIAKDKREILTDNLSNLDSIIETVIDLHKIKIDPVTTLANFSDSQEIREGWLVLRKVNQVE
ncbi:MAG: hypothetical protein QNJ64_13260 [Crocosphaera sp.]|nr:hypothetical protein [Crocosphaera sp.]